MAEVTKRCETCEYYTGGRIASCDYIGYEHHKRPCQAGDACRVYKPYKGRKRQRNITLCDYTEWEECNRV